MADQGFYEYVMEMFTQVGGITGRKMFGGYGVYQDGVCFALISGSKLYMKVTDLNQKDYEAAGSKQFSYEMKNGKHTMVSFWELPSDILEDRSELPGWIEKAVQAAKESKKEK
jgi:DNA transformation protein